MYKLILGLVICMLLSMPMLTSAAAPVTQEVSAFPLAKGTYWVYQGPTKWTKSGTDQVTEKVLTWKMEVTESIQREQVLAAVVKGHPLDLASYDETTKPGEYLIVQVGADKFYLVAGDRVQDDLKKLRDQEDVLTDLVQDADLFLDMPLKQGKIFGETMQITRQDQSYYWIVDKEEQVKLSGIKGYTGTAAVAQYQLVFRTNSDNQAIGFTPGLGFTTFTYRHNGTVAETDLKLIEFHHGK